MFWAPLFCLFAILIDLCAGVCAVCTLQTSHAHAFVCERSRDATARRENGACGCRMEHTALNGTTSVSYAHRETLFACVFVGDSPKQGICIVDAATADAMCVRWCALSVCMCVCAVGSREPCVQGAARATAQPLACAGRVCTGTQCSR